MHTDKEKLKWHEEKWGENEEPDKTPTERPHCDNGSLKNQDKNFNEKPIIIDGVEVQQCLFIGVNGLTAYKIPYCREFTNNCKDNPNCYFKQLARKSQECEELKKQLETSEEWRIKAEGLNEKLDLKNTRYRKALEEIEKIAQNGLSPICYKSNCSCCRCYDGDDCNTSMTALINNYFTENGEFVDGSGDFVEALEALLESERKKCNKAQPIAQRILDIINKADFGKSERSETRPGESCVEPVEPPIIQEAKGEE